MADLLKSPLQKVHIPFEIYLAIYYSSSSADCSLSYSIRYEPEKEKDYCDI